ncbi:DUF3784 domain-containing protein [Rossellomorea aquimaris]|uniref:DUF3784 domain-containing protein n=1 Tax=Rossellomorea aquimaris TaxID=189382 RepID=UPI0005C8C604|nr:DUF3784 domain-containing protein [Rossellomorea aquimaris]
MAILIGIQLIVIVLFSLLGWAIRVKKNYGLISGFVTRSKTEQAELIKNGYPQKTGSLLIYTAVGMLILLPLAFTSFSFVTELQFGFMLVFLMGGFIYLSKYEVSSKRKRSYWISSTLFVVIVGFVSVLTYLGYEKYELIVKDESFEVTGLYGEVWKFENVDKVELMEDMPEVTWKINGFGLSTMAKGEFKVKGYGKSLLFLHKEAPYVYIRVNDQHLFLNGGNPGETKEWYDELSKSID